MIWNRKSKESKSIFEFVRNLESYNDMIALSNRINIVPSIEKSSGMNLNWPLVDWPPTEWDFWKKERCENH